MRDQNWNWREILGESRKAPRKTVREGGPVEALLNLFAKWYPLIFLRLSSLVSFQHGCAFGFLFLLLLFFSL